MTLQTWHKAMSAHKDLGHLLATEDMGSACEVSSRTWARPMFSKLMDS